jgi:hypothetical protein
VIEGRFHATPHHLRAGRREPIAQHVPARIVLEESKGRATIQFRQGLTQSDKRLIEVGRRRKGVRQGSEGTWRHEERG